jgi:hypothetical protein
VPIASAKVFKSMNDAILDIRSNYKTTSHSFLMILGGKDRIVDNQASREFYNKTGTPADRKQIKLFSNSYHQVHKEGTLKSEFYETIYKYISKTLQQGKFTLSSPTLAFGGLKSFEVGRAANAKKYPYCKTVILMLAVAYLAVGILI